MAQALYKANDDTKRKSTSWPFELERKNREEGSDVVYALGPFQGKYGCFYLHRIIIWDICKSSALVSRGARVASYATGRSRRLEGIQEEHQSKIRAFIIQWRHHVREAQGTMRKSV